MQLLRFSFDQHVFCLFVFCCFSFILCCFLVVCNNIVCALWHSGCQTPVDLLYVHYVTDYNIICLVKDFLGSEGASGDAACPKAAGYCCLYLFTNKTFTVSKQRLGSVGEINCSLQQFKVV